MKNSEDQLETGLVLELGRRRESGTSSMPWMTRLDSAITAEVRDTLWRSVPARAKIKGGKQGGEKRCRCSISGPVQRLVCNEWQDPKELISFVVGLTTLRRRWETQMVLQAQCESVGGERADPEQAWSCLEAFSVFRLWRLRETWTWIRQVHGKSTRLSAMLPGDAWFRQQETKEPRW